MELKGKVIEVGQVDSGTSAAVKDWKRGDFTIEFKDGEYDKNASFTLFNDKTEILDKMGVGDEVTVSFNIDSRKHNERWYTNLQAWKVMVDSVAEKRVGEDGLPF